jgi:phosphoglycolate phosphatase-like HAD superfamily hydrolase
MVFQKPLAIIVDLDGTLCDNAHRLHHIVRPDDAGEAWRKDWNAFRQGIPDDKCNRAVERVVRWAMDDEVSAIYVTGRWESDSPAIGISWLYGGISPHPRPKEGREASGQVLCLWQKR